MHLAYSAINNNKTQKRFRETNPENELCIRYRAYQAACDKFSNEIAAIQQYIPGWMPACPSR